MIKEIHNWEYKWFGIWREYGPKYVNCPSIKKFIAPEIVKEYDLSRLKTYLSSCCVLAATSRINFPDPFTGDKSLGSIAYRTDGEWLWLDDLSDYIEKYSVALPVEFYNKIVRNEFRPVVSWNGDEAELAWPPILD